MMCLNRMAMLGRVGNDPVVKQAGNSQVAEVSIALSEKYKDANKETQERTEWVSFIAWGKLAEIAEKYVRKGSLVYAEGKLQTRKWKDKEGNDRSRTEVYGTQLIALDGKPAADKPASAPQHDYTPRQDAKTSYKASRPSREEEDFGEDLPF